MVAIWAEHASAFLLVIGAGTLVVFAIPIFLVPFSWARMFGWSIPEESDLALYFGRCLGGVACVIAGTAIAVTFQPTLQPFFFQFLIAVFAALTWIHVLGAIQRVQPPSETLEVAFWGALLVLALCFYPSASG